MFECRIGILLFSHCKSAIFPFPFDCNIALDADIAFEFDLYEKQVLSRIWLSQFCLQVTENWSKKNPLPKND